MTEIILRVQAEQQQDIMENGHSTTSRGHTSSNKKKKQGGEGSPEAHQQENTHVVSLAGGNNCRNSRKRRSSKKHPNAPKRFRTSYIIFAQRKHKEIKEELALRGIDDKTTIEITKMVSLAWKDLDCQQREEFEALSRKDKARMELEMSMYKGPLEVPIQYKRTNDSTAPKKPQSAFLAFSNKRRASVKRSLMSSGATSIGDISKRLSEMWKEAAPEQRQRYQDEERRLRAEYKAALAVWKGKEDAKLQRRQANASLLAEAMTTLAAGDGGPLASTSITMM